MKKKRNKLLDLFLAYEGQNLEEIDSFLTKQCKKVVKKL